MNECKHCGTSLTRDECIKASGFCVRDATIKENKEPEVRLVWTNSAAMEDMLCPKCFKPFEHFLRHMIKRNFAGFWRLLGRPTECVICSHCKEIVGYE